MIKVHIDRNSKRNGFKNNLKQAINHPPIYFWLLITLGYVSFINFFVLKSTPELIFLQFLLITAIFLKARTYEFFKTWIPFIGIFLLYEFLRSIADDVSPFYDQVLYWAYNVEVEIFNELPTKVLQDNLGNNQIFLLASVFFYSTFFYFSFLIAFLLWLKNPQLFKKYTQSFVLLTYIALAIFFLIPTAPPWFVNQIQNLGIERLLFKENAPFFSLSWLSLYKYFIGSNYVAAMPSLHVAWPMFTTLFLIREFKKKVFYLLLIFPLGVAFAIVFTGEHYIVDVLAGWFLAFAIILINFSENKLLSTFVGKIR